MILKFLRRLFGRKPVRLAQSPTRDSIIARLAGRSDDELAVIDYVLSGLEYGSTVYGPLNVGTDGRDWDRESAQELRDFVVYQAARLIAAYRRGK